MPIVYNGKDVTEAAVNGTLDTKAIAAEMRQNGGVPVEGFFIDDATREAVKGITDALMECLRDGPQIPINEPRAGL